MPKDSSATQPAPTMGRIDRLKRRKHIETLFHTGKAFSISPFRVVYLLQPACDGAQIKMGISVPKKKLRRAVDRNRVKRLVREAFRLQRHTLAAQVPAGQQLHLFFIYTPTSIYTYGQIWPRLAQCLDRICAHLAK